MTFSAPPVMLLTSKSYRLNDQPLIELPPPTVASNLPAPMTSLVNRVADLAAVTALLQRDDVRLVTVIGPPGMGKTRLSIAAAQQALPRFAGGVCFVDLSAITDPTLLLPTVAITLGSAALHPVCRLRSTCKVRCRTARYCWCSTTSNRSSSARRLTLPACCVRAAA